MRRAAAPPTKATPVAMPPVAAPPVEELLDAPAVPVPLADDRVLVPVPVKVVSEPVEVKVDVSVPLPDPEGLTAVPVGAGPVAAPEPVAAEAPLPVAIVPVAVAAAESVETAVTADHWLLNEARRPDCCAAMEACKACASDWSWAPAAVTVAWKEANSLLIETTWAA